MKNDTLQRFKYIFMDTVAAICSYTILYVFRRVVTESGRFEVNELSFNNSYYLGLLLIPAFWITIYFVTAFYRDIYRRSRLKELIYTFNASLLGGIFIFFALILDDWVENYTDYYRGFLVYFVSHFVLTGFGRFIISSNTAHRIRKGKISFNTLLIGSNDKAAELYTEIGNRTKTGNQFVGFVSVHNNIHLLVEKNLEHLGTHTQLPEVIERYSIEEVIIAIESSEHEKLENIINILQDTDVKVKMIPDTYDIISGKVKMEALASAPLIELNHELMPLWQSVVKRVFDIVVSALLLILLSPLLIFSAIMVKLSSDGPIFYTQIRSGENAKDFSMIKFRSMCVDAEKDGPQLSSENDSRITKWGRIMRKYRLDELPQFWNVLIGDMSIVGPRPERQYYIDLIKQKAPHYKHVQRVKPGITSWGMVKFGYAENVDEMVQRLKYDIIYIENMNLFNDLKILIYTVLIVLQGRGK
ncbi:sugar transferase [Owenweeksia hongkongensis]|uniref:sugar transferase n=1 Tax=Owenweeksia hongkongensis TaxID=253245 RepID=UPI003A8EC26D